MIDAIRILKVIWNDPHSIDEWCDTAEAADSELCSIVTVGIYVKETVEKLVLALNVDLTGDQVSCTMIIPKKCIVSTQEVAYVKKIL